MSTVELGRVREDRDARGLLQKYPKEPSSFLERIVAAVECEDNILATAQDMGPTHYKVCPTKRICVLNIP